VIYTLRFQKRRNCQRYCVEGIPQNELPQLQNPWYLSNFSIYSPNTSTQFDVNKISHVTWKISFLEEYYSLTDVNRQYRCKYKPNCIAYRTQGCALDIQIQIQINFIVISNIRILH
jgi:hypothetical protein